MLLEIGSQIDLLLRTGEWVRNATLLNVANSTLTVKLSYRQQQVLDMHQDVAIINKSTMLSV